MWRYAAQIRRDFRALPGKRNRWASRRPIRAALSRFPTSNSLTAFFVVRGSLSIISTVWWVGRSPRQDPSAHFSSTGHAQVWRVRERRSRREAVSRASAIEVFDVLWRVSSAALRERRPSREIRAPLAAPTIQVGAAYRP